MTKITIVFAVMACGHTAPAIAPANSAALQTPPAAISTTTHDDTLMVRMQLRARRGRVTFDVAPDDMLHSGDYVELRVEVNVKAYVYVVQLPPGGNSVLLFPEAGDIMLVPGVSTRIPFASNRWYQLDDDAGTETVYVVASRAPIGKIDDALGNEIRAIRDAAAATPVAEPAPMTSQQPTPGLDAGLSRPPRRSARPERMLTMGNRGLRKVVTINGRSLVDTTVSVQNHGLVVAWFSFHHAR